MDAIDRKPNGDVEFGHVDLIHLFPQGLLSKWKPKSFGIVLFATKIGGRVRLGLSNHASSKHESFHIAVWVVSLVPGKMSWPGYAEHISLS
jgi:hypothetical protein